MLAVDIHQTAAQRPQLRHGDRPSADPADIFAIRADLPLEHQIAVLIRCSAQVFTQRRIHAGEQRTDKRLIGAGTDQIPGRPLTQYSAHGVNDNGLTGTGLTGQGIETLLKGDLRLLDDGNILNMEQFQHSSPPCTLQCSICFTCSQKSSAWTLSWNTIKMVSSPASVPTMSVSSMLSSAKAAPCAMPSMVRSTTIF